MPTKHSKCIIMLNLHTLISSHNIMFTRAKRFSHWSNWASSCLSSSVIAVLQLQGCSFSLHCLVDTLFCFIVFVLPQATSSYDHNIWVTKLTLLASIISEVTSSLTCGLIYVPDIFEPIHLLLANSFSWIILKLMKEVIPTWCHLCENKHESLLQ